MMKTLRSLKKLIGIRRLAGLNKIRLMFRRPNIFEWANFLSIFFLYLNMIFKIIYHNQYLDIGYKDTEFLELGDLEEFYY
jgi:hypothetical protein